MKVSCHLRMRTRVSILPHGIYRKRSSTLTKNQTSSKLTRVHENWRPNASLKLATELATVSYCKSVNSILVLVAVYKCLKSCHPLTSRAVYTVLGHISDAEELSDVITKTDDYLWLKVRKLLNTTPQKLKTNNNLINI